MGILEPLDEWLGDAKDRFIDALVQPTGDVVLDGKIYGAPLTFCNGALAVRKDILEGLGIDPYSIKTWDDFKQVAEKVTQSPNQYATALMMAEPRMISLDVGWWAVSNGLDNIADFKPERKENYIQLLQFLSDLFPYMPPAQSGWIHRDSMTAYANGITTMYATASYFFGEIKPIAPDVMSDKQTILIPMPYGPKLKRPRIAIYTVGYVMFKDAEHKKEAAEFLKWWLSEEVLNEFPMNLAPLKGLAVDDRVRVSEYGEDLRWFQEQCFQVLNDSDTFGLKPVVPGEEIYRIFTEEMLKLYQKEVTPEQAYENMRKQIVPLQQEE
jgi:ABC-type glycerol-3-phosphate transport system substrate-binding protein